MYTVYARRRPPRDLSVPIVFPVIPDTLRGSRQVGKSFGECEDPGPMLRPETRSRLPARRYLLGFAAGAIVLVLLLRLWLEFVGPLPGERWAAEHFRAWPPPPYPWSALVTFTELIGTPLFAIVGVGLAVYLVARGLGLAAAWFVAVASAGVVPNGILKVVLGPTPFWRETHEVFGPNYPSGHVVYAVVFAGSLAWLAYERGRRDLVLIALAPIVLMGPMRVVGASHLPSDVIAGYLFGAAWLAGAVALMRTGAKRSV